MISRTCAVWLWAWAFLSVQPATAVSVQPATAVKVNNLTEGFDDESTALEQKAQLSARYAIGRFHAGLEVRVLAAVDEKPVENVMVYLKPIEGEEITTVHNTDHDGIARIEKIAERKRTHSTPFHKKERTGLICVSEIKKSRKLC